MKLMTTFTDNLDRPWPVRIDYLAAQRVRHATHTNILDFKTIAEVMESLKFDGLFVAQVAHAICEPTIRERKLTEASFADGLQGDAIERASEAILEALLNFFPKGQQSLLAKMKKTMDELALQGMKEAETEIANASGGSASSLVESSD